MITYIQKKKRMINREIVMAQINSYVAPLRLILFTFLFTWTPWVFLAFTGGDEPTSNPLYIVGGLGPVFGFIFAKIYDKRTKKVWSNPYTKHKSWTNLIVLLPFVSAVPVLLSGVFGVAILNKSFDVEGWHASVSDFGGIYLFILLIFVGGPLTEEFSWHGYLWPRVRNLYGIYRAGLIAGVIWTMWHLPLFLLNGTSQNEGIEKSGYVFFFLISCILQMIMWGQYYELTGFGMASAVLAHFSLNLSSFIITFDWRIRTVEMVINIVVIIVLKRMVQSRNSHPINLGSVQNKRESKASG